MTAPLDHIRVRDVMHHGILSCSPDAPLADIARMMATRRVHAVAIMNRAAGRPVGVMSDLDLVAAVVAGGDPNAPAAPSAQPLEVSAEDTLQRAAQLMSEHGVAHLVVRDAASGYPIGVLSTLDIAAAYAGGTT